MLIGMDGRFEATDEGDEEKRKTKAEVMAEIIAKSKVRSIH